MSVQKPWQPISYWLKYRSVENFRPTYSAPAPAPHHSICKIFSKYSCSLEKNLLILAFQLSPLHCQHVNFALYCKTLTLNKKNLKSQYTYSIQQDVLWEVMDDGILLPFLTRALYIEHSLLTSISI